MGYRDESVDVCVLIDRVLSKAEQRDGALVLTCHDGTVYEFSHDQDWCESVDVVDIVGSLDDLIGVPLIMAEVEESEDAPEGLELPEGHDDCWLWTFYKFATVKGYVTVRWFGESNGYYSVGVNCWRKAQLTQ